MRAAHTIAAALAIIISCVGCGRGLSYRNPTCTGFCYAYQGATIADGISYVQSISWQPSITVEARVRMDAVPASSAVIFRAPMGSSDVMLDINNTNQLHFEYPSTASCVAVTGITGISTPLSVGQTYHVAATVTETGTTYLYVNGAMINNQAGPVASSFSCTSVTHTVGNLPAQTSGFVGVIDDLRVSTSASPRYGSGGFTIPSGPQSLDAAAVLLLSFDNREGVGTFISTSVPTAMLAAFSGAYVKSPF